MTADAIRTVILAGGKGQRLGAQDQPKPLTPINGRPVIEHVMAIFARQGFRDFTIATGHQGQAIADYVTTQTRRPTGLWQNDWRVTCHDTGEDTATGGRLLKLRDRLGDELGTAPFFLTWADGLADIDLAALLAFHRGHGRMASVTAVYPPPRFGHLDMAGDRVTAFAEKPVQREGRINGAFFVMQPGVIDLIDDAATVLEHAPMQRLVEQEQLMAYRHDGFWQCMDTPAEAERLDGMARVGDAPWLAGP